MTLRPTLHFQRRYKSNKRRYSVAQTTGKHLELFFCSRTTLNTLGLGGMNYDEAGPKPWLRLGWVALKRGPYTAKALATRLTRASAELA